MAKQPRVTLTNNWNSNSIATGVSSAGWFESHFSVNICTGSAMT